jgi:tetratricopeptide (TPR) repeat protein
MSEQQLLQTLQELGLPEGKQHLQVCYDETRQSALIGAWLEQEALDKLYAPFTSLKFAELLLFLGTYAHDRHAYALGLKARGDALVQMGHYTAAMGSLDEAAAIFCQEGDTNNQARSRISWIVACAWLGRIDEALLEARQTREFFLMQGEPFWACTIDNNIAVIYDHLGRSQEALALYERMRAVYLSLADQQSVTVRRGLALVDLNQAISLAWLGRFAEAYTLQSRARESLHDLAEVNLQLIAEVNIADLNYMQGSYGSALRSYYHALDVARDSLSDPSRLARLKLWTANCLVKVNRVQEARRLSSEAVVLYREFDLSLNTGLAQLTHATALAACGQTDKAIAALSEAEDLFVHAGFAQHTLTAQLQKAELLLNRNEAAAAYAQARRIQAFGHSQGRMVSLIQAELLMASALLALSDQAQADDSQRGAWIQEARQLCRHLAPLAHQHNLQETTYKCYYLLGRIASRANDLGQAGRYYLAAIAQIERILADLIYDLSPAFLRTAWAVYGDMVALCLARDQVAPAFTYLERARSMALRQYLIHADRTQRQGDPGNAPLAPLRLNLLRTQEQLKDWQDRYRQYSLLLTQLDPSVSDAVRRETIQQELARCETTISELFERLSLYQQERPPSTPRPGRASVRRPFDLTRLQMNLAEDQTLLAYFLHDQQLILFALTARTLVWRQIPDGAGRLEKLLPFLFAHIQMGAWLQGPDQRPQPRVLRTLLHDLYTLLIAPVEAFLPAHNGLLTIVPYGPLHGLPFHALFNGAHFLIEHFQVHYVPASILLDFTQKHSASPAAGAPEKAGEHARPLVLGYSGNGHLQHALSEARLLAALLQGRCYLEEEATIACLEREAPGSSVIHIATHGQSRPDAPNFSSLLLADGQLNAIDAFSLNLQGCELVTLSGCETSLSLSSGGDEQLGLGRAFLAAGAQTLVMSLWPVEDRMTGEFMKRFYRNLLRGERKVQALRAAQCEFLAHPHSRSAHPYFWAAFRLVGEVHPLSSRLPRPL